jgi:hypothetical protein
LLIQLSVALEALSCRLKRDKALRTLSSASHQGTVKSLAQEFVVLEHEQSFAEAKRLLLRRQWSRRFDPIFKAHCKHAYDARSLHWPTVEAKSLESVLCEGVCWYSKGCDFDREWPTTWSDSFG